MTTIIITREGYAHSNEGLHAFGIFGKDAASFKGEKREFDSIEEAQEYLKNVAIKYYDGNEDKIKRNLSSGSLRIDTVTARIVE